MASNGHGALTIPEAGADPTRWSAASGSQFDDAPTLRNTMRSEYDYKERVSDVPLAELGRDGRQSGLTEKEWEEQPAALATLPPQGDFPDGGLRAWLVVVGVSSLQILSCNDELTGNRVGRLQHHGNVSAARYVRKGYVDKAKFRFGYVNAWGAFQAYYQEHTLSGTSPSTM